MLAGRVGRPHGLDGSFHVVEPVGAVLVAGAPLGGDLGRIEGRKGTDAKPIVRVSAASDREGAEALRGRELDVLDAEAPALGEDEYLAADLEGCAVVVEGEPERSLGRVARMLAYPSCEVLELEDGTLVPLVRDAVVSVDVEAKRISVDGGFLGAA